MLYARRHRSIKTLAAVSVEKISRSNSSSRNVPLKDSTSPFSHGLPGSMNNVWTVEGLKPQAYECRRECRSVVRPDVRRDAVCHKQRR